MPQLQQKFVKSVTSYRIISFRFLLDDIHGDKNEMYPNIMTGSTIAQKHQKKESEVKSEK